MTEKANRKSLARSADSGGRPRPCGDRGARKSKRAIRSHDPVARLPGSRHRKGSDHWHNSSPPRPLDIDRPADGLDGAAKDIGTVQVRRLDDPSNALSQKPTSDMAANYVSINVVATSVILGLAAVQCRLLMNATGPKHMAKNRSTRLDSAPHQRKA